MDIADANKNPLKNLSYIPLLVRLDTRTVLRDFGICDKLVAPVILGCDFCDRLVDEIWHPVKNVEVLNGSAALIVSKPLKHATKKRVTIPAAQEMQSKDPVSTKLRIAHSVAVPLQSKVWITVISKQIGYHVFRSLSSLYD